MHKSTFTIGQTASFGAPPGTRYNPLIFLGRSSMPAIRFDKFYKYDELTAILQSVGK